MKNEYFVILIIFDFLFYKKDHELLYSHPRAFIFYLIFLVSVGIYHMQRSTWHYFLHALMMNGGNCALEFIKESPYHESLTMDKDQMCIDLAFYYGLDIRLG